MPVDDLKMRGSGSPPIYPSRYDVMEKINEIIELLNDIERRVIILEKKVERLESYH